MHQKFQTKMKKSNYIMEKEGGIHECPLQSLAKPVIMMDWPPLIPIDDSRVIQCSL